MALCCADSGEVPHTERGTGLHDLSHTVPTLTISVLSPSCAVHPPTDTHTLTQTPLPTVQQQHSPHPVPQTHITVHNTCYSTTFPSPCPSDTHHSTQYMLLHNIPLTLSLRHTSQYTIHVTPQHSPHPVPQTHITVHNICYSMTHNHRFTNSHVRHVVTCYGTVTYVVEMIFKCMAIP